MSSVILTHETSTELGDFRLSYPTNLTIQVIFDKTYTIRFHESIPRRHGPSLVCVEKVRYIRDIPYFPNAMIDAIKLMRLPNARYMSGNNYLLHDLTNAQGCATSPGDELFDGLSRIFSDKFRSDIKSEEFAQEFTKIKIEHEKMQKELIDTHNQKQTELNDRYTQKESELIDRYTQTQTELKSVTSELTKVRTELKDAYDNNRSIGFEVYEVKNKNNDLQQSLKTCLQENEKLSNDMITLAGTNAELRGKNERLVGLINEEKLKNLSLSNKLSDITDLYESLLTTSVHIMNH